MRLLVVIPTYNEAENLPRLVSALFALPLDLGVLVVDDNSPDGTGEIAEALKARFPGRVEVLHRAGKSGLGPAYLAGFQKALQMEGVAAIAQMDADFSHNPAVLPQMATLLENDQADLVLGSRYVPGGRLDEAWPLWRKGLSAFGNFYARAILRMPVRDVTGGYRLWRRETLANLPLARVHAAGYLFQVEMAYLTHKLGFRIAEVPIYFQERRWGQSKMSFAIQVEAAIGVWQLLWRYRDL
ncbi:MAG TPA: polyprenol monophosphomannose synthase [Chloroflexi bacterium]|nr:polyprenol monophosphomannose synthase [Chloroflexota bacterium]